MAVEGEVSAVQGGLAVDQRLHAAVPRPGERPESSPEEAVVNDEEIGPPADCCNDGFAGVHGHREAPDTLGPRDLKSVHGARIVRSPPGIEIPVEKADDLLQGDPGRARS